MKKLKNPFEGAYRDMVAEIEKAEAVVELVKVYKDYCNSLEEKLDRLTALINGGKSNDQTK